MKFLSKLSKIYFLGFLMHLLPQRLLSEEIPYTAIIKTLEKKGRLPHQDCRVGFDLDDTILYSSPGFWKGQKEFGSNFIYQDKFWEKMNTSYDQFSLPKKIVINMLNEHLKYDHKIFIITARQQSSNNKVLEILKENILSLSQKDQNLSPLKEKIRNLNHIYFTNGESKAPILKKFGIHIYYGDSESDKMSVQQSEKTTFIRIKRKNSSFDLIEKQSITKDEYVLEDSDVVF